MPILVQFTIGVLILAVAYLLVVVAVKLVKGDKKDKE